MKRTGITRKTPLTGGAPLARTPMKRTSPPMQRGTTKAPQARRYTGASVDVKALVDARDDRRCVICGGPGSNRHHRRNRGAGGSKDPAINLPSNLVIVCGSGSTGCHGMVTTPSAFGTTYEAVKANGWVIGTNTTHDPATQPIKTWQGWYLLLNDGSKIPYTATNNEG